MWPRSQTGGLMIGSGERCRRSRSSGAKSASVRSLTASMRSAIASDAGPMAPWSPTAPSQSRDASHTVIFLTRGFAPSARASATQPRLAPDTEAPLLEQQAPVDVEQQVEERDQEQDRDDRGHR